MQPLRFIVGNDIDHGCNYTLVVLAHLIKSDESSIKPNIHIFSLVNSFAYPNGHNIIILKHILFFFMGRDISLSSGIQLLTFMFCIVLSLNDNNDDDDNDAAYNHTTTT